MAKALIIVESPTKTKTLKNILGNDYQIEATMGHVRDLPEKKLGVDIENDFEPTYVRLKDRGDVLDRLAAAAKNADTIYLASDPDREGEAISWHVAEALNLKKPIRIQFNEYTRQAVQNSMANPRTIDMDMVNAQQARRVLDRLVGYKLSPVLWQKIQKGLSAGRVQSVAVRLICERERDIQAFVPVEYWSLTATLTPQPPEKRFPFPTKLHSRGGKRLELKSEPEVQAILADLNKATYTVADVKKRSQNRNAAPPFITSTLQQEAARKLGFSNRRTMSTAQSLYEGVELGDQGSVGLITYMRTDSVRVAEEMQGEARQFIAQKYGPNYVPIVPTVYKTKGSAQDAHEAIRPTSAFREPDVIASDLSSDQLRLYRLIWQRFIASQMNPAVMDVTTADIDAVGPAMYRDAKIASETVLQGAPDAAKVAPYVFRATGTVVKFDGFMRVYTEGKDTEEVGDDEQPPLPPLSKSQSLDLIKLDPRQHFTEPPPRYTEATFVKALEEQGIGRPSTYVSIIQVIRDREYVELKDKRFYPTELGFKVNDQLVKHFPSVMDIKFTADMETKLDEVEEGRADWIELLRNFYDPFEQQIKTAKVEMENLKPQAVESDYHCPDTGVVMLLRTGRYGPFLGCSDYPKCKRILNLNPDGTPIEGANFRCGLLPAEPKALVDPASLPNATDYVCPLGHGGRMMIRKGRFGPFLGCSEYPKCRTLLKCTPDGTMQQGQEFACTYSEENAVKGKAKKTGATRGGAKKTTAKKTAAPKTTVRAKAPTTRTTAVKSTSKATTSKSAGAGAAKPTAKKPTGATAAKSTSGIVGTTAKAAPKASKASATATLTAEHEE